MAILDTDTLVSRLRALPPPPRDAGVVRLVVLRKPDEQRELPGKILLDPDQGAVGDRWIHGKADPRAQVTAMRHDVALLLRDGEDPSQLGDNLFLDLDLSNQNLPPGTELSVGAARVRVTPKAHTGCSKFSRRVGADALELTRSPGWKDQNLRGVHLAVLQGGPVADGDPIVVLSRP